MNVMKKPAVSIVIPAYNEEKWMRNCLESIAKQNIAKQIEVLIVDDDSEDDTVKIARSFSKKINVRIVRNGTHDAEIGKKKGLDAAKGKYFMYFDADMEFADTDWFSKNIELLEKEKETVGVLASFKPKKTQNPLTRCISYDVFQRDPIFKAFTPNIDDTIIKEENGYKICRFSEGKIPCQSLCLYRLEIIKKIFGKDPYLMDNDVPVRLVKKGYTVFGFRTDIGIYHYILENLGELFKKRMRGVLKTYMKHLHKREYKWFNLEDKKNIILMGAWVLYANLLFPGMFVGIYKAFKYRDTCLLYYPIINMVSTDALIFGFLKSKKGVNSLLKV